MRRIFTCLVTSSRTITTHGLWLLSPDKYSNNNTANTLQFTQPLNGEKSEILMEHIQQNLFIIYS